MNSEEAAQNMVGYYSTVMPVIRNHPVYVQFSNHKELKTDNSPNQEVRLIHYCLQLLASVCHCQPVFILCPSSLSQRAQAALRALSTSHVDTAVAAPSSVLRVVVENLVYPVSLDALCQVTRHDTQEKKTCLVSVKLSAADVCEHTVCLD